MSMVGLQGSPLSHQQNRLWSWRKNNLACPTLCAIQIRGSLQRERFKKAVECVIQRHEILHTVFYTLPGMDVPMQVVHDDYLWSGAEISLEQLEISHRLSKIDDLFIALQKDVCDLQHGPLFSLWLFHLAVDRYILVVSLPALCADSRSMNLFIDELAKAYAQQALGEDVLQYADVSAWQEALLQEDEAESEREYWRKTDLSRVNALRLPFEREEPSAGKVDDDAFIPHMVEVPLSHDLLQQIKMRAQQHDALSSAFFLACWQVLLWRLSDDPNFIVGVACNGRAYEELTNALGLYMRFFPINAYFEYERSFELVLASVNRSLLEAIKRQMYFVWDEMNSPTSDASAPFFPISFEYDTWSAPSDTSELTFSLFKRWSCTEPFVLKLSVLQVGEQVQVEMHYDRQHIPIEQVCRLAEMFQTLLRSVVEQPHASVGTMMLLTVREQKDLLTMARGPIRSCSAQGLHSLFEAQVQRTPTLLAAISTREQLTYQQLNERANRLAWVLRKRGVGPQVVVGLCLERQAQMLAGLLGILKVRGAYLPLDPTTPQARLTYQLQKSGTLLLLTQRGIDLHFPGWGGEILYLEDLETELAQASAEDLLIESYGKDLAYVIYTSGSTGMPKGVMIQQSSIVNYTLGLCEQLGAEPGWQYATVSTLAADLGNTAIFCALASGGCVQMLDYETVTSAEAMVRWVERHPIDVLKIVPSHLSALLTGEQAKALLPRRALVLGGEALPMSLLTHLQALGGTCQVYNHYGPTETTIGVIVKPLGVLEAANEEQKEWKQVPLGRPIANTEIYIVDRRMQLVPEGVRGEIYLGGEGLAMGYMCQAEQTAERFVPHPWSQEPGARLYRTGDLAYSEDGGDVVFVGRGDRQVKLRGYRIEVTEIEAALRNHPHVRTAVVMLREDLAGEPYLVSYVVAQQQMIITSSQVREFLRRSLPEYMLPTQSFQIEALPLTANGKIDWQKLPMLEQEAEREQRLIIGSGGPIEEIVGEIWKDLLDVSIVGNHDNFFAVGGHSLLATRVIAHIQTAFQVTLPMQTFFEAPTVAALALRIEQALRQDTGIELLPLVAGVRPFILPLSFAQQRLWFLDQLEPGSTAYLIPSALRLEGTLNGQALEQALEVLIERHESLRTTFELQDGQPVQVIHPATHCTMPMIDLHGLGHEQADAQAHRLASQEMQHPCDLAQGPLLRSTLLHLEEEEHVLLLTLHHIITDGWSNELLVQELATLYEVVRAGEASPLAPLPIQYADYALWQRAWLQGEVLEAQLAYWRTQLAGVSALELPIDHPHPAVQTSRGARLPFQLSSVLLEQLEILSQQEHVTLFMLLLAAFQVLLARSSGQQDISVGTPIANRRQAEVEGVIGFFVNTLVMRTDLSGDPTFQQVLQRVRKICLEAYGHQDVPFEKVVEELAPERDLSRSPLFQVMLTMQNMPTGQVRQTDLRIASLEVESTVSQFDLSLTLAEMEHGLFVGVEYNTDLFEAETITRLLGHWQILLEGIVQNPQVQVWQLPFLTHEEQSLLLVDWNATGDASLEDCWVHELFEQQVQRTPEAIALVFEEQQLSYAQLNGRANQLAQQLRMRGIGPEVLVGVFMERSPQVLIALLALFKTGGVSVPLDPGSPAERLRWMAQEAQFGLILTQEHLVATFPLTPLPVLSVDRESLSWSPEPCEDVMRPIVGKELAYVIYTSGSTGRPKGAMIEQQGMLNHLLSKIQDVTLTNADRVAQTASLSFDISVWQLLSALLVGGCTVIYAQEIVTDPPRLLERMQADQISIVELVPSFLQALLEHVEGWSPSARRLPQVRWMVPTGEALAPGLCRRWFALYPEIALLNAYGPTECSDDVASYALLTSPDSQVQRVPIGRPVRNLRLYVLDQHQRLLPMGSTGELFVGGVGVGRGYLNDAPRTAAVYVPDPFTDEAGQRLYKTGDRVRYQADGALEFLGRMDQQVKMRGYRIELGEIESALQAHPAIQEAVVLMAEEGYLVAYVVVVPGERLTGKEVRQALQESLPSYMLPSAYVFLEAFPLTGNGKVDRQAFPRPEGIEAEGQQMWQRGKRTPQEELLVGLWQEVLGGRYVGMHENFFERGGHSLLATHLLARVREVLGVEMPLRAIFEEPTVAGFAQRVEQMQREGDEVSMPPLVAGERPEVLPLSFAQQRLWFLDQLEPGSTAYLIPDTLSIDGRLDGRALEHALETLIERHESLRTTFEERDGQARQVIHPVAPSTVPMIDLHGLGHEQAEVQAHRLATQEMQRPCDLVRGPLLRCTLLHLEEEEHVLLLTVHHIITDGWSNEVLVQELTTLYEAMKVGEASPLAPLPMQYADYALWQRAWLQGEVLEAQLVYWRTQLAGVSALELPTDHPRPAVQMFRGALQPFQLSPILLEQLVALSRQEHVTLFMLLLASFQVLLARYSGQQDISVGTPIANRHQTEIEGVIGFFVNTLVMRTDLSGDPTFQEVLQRVRELCLGAYSHQDVPFEKVVEELAPERDLSRSPLFQVMLVLQNIPQGQTDPSELRIGSLEVERSISKFDLTLSLAETGERLLGALEYNTDLFEAETIERLLGHWQVLLEGIVQNPQAQVWQLPLLTQEEQNQLLNWNTTGVEDPEEWCVHELFEQQVLRTPEAVALVFEEQQLTYEQLNGRANQLAHYLHGLGVGPEVLVGICLQRSVELIIGVLGVLKAGGAYVPLDPTSPKERLDFLLQDADLSLVVTQQSTVEQIASSSVHVLLLDALWSELLLLPQHAPLSSSSVEHLAYMIYTSGSTGTPKGVQVTHRGVGILGQAQAEIFSVGAGSRVLQFASLTFDASVSELVMALLSGASLHLLQAEQLLPGPDLVQMLREQAVSVVTLPPSALAVLPPESLPDLQTLVVAGEACRVEVMEQWAGGRHFYNAYGPTEATVCATVGECAPEQGIVQGSLSLGRPLGTTQVYVLDPALQLVPLGVVGEICLGGSGLARGYLKRAEQTAERFVPHPFSREAGAQLYRTGDQARYRADGSLEYLGRLDTQVKIRGYRIELGEIEAWLQGYPGIKEAVVLLREDVIGNKQLVAYVVGQSGEQAVSSEVRRYLQERLPGYMVPSQIVFLAVLPLTGNGKVDRRALPVPTGISHAGEGYLAPRTAIEKLLAVIWADVLHIREVGIHENFFERGGDSIIAIQIIARARQQGLQLTLKQLFQYQTIAQLSTVVAKGVLVRAEQGLVQGSVPLTPIQRWFFAQDLMVPHHWNQALFLELHEQVQGSFLRQVVEAWLRHHDALRLRFHPIHDGWHASHATLEGSLPFWQMDLSALFDEDQDVVPARLAGQTQASLDLEQGLLLRVIVFARGKVRSPLLLLVVHHLVVDGVSWRILLDDLHLAYQQLRQGQGITLPAKTSSFKAWAEHLSDYAQSSDIQQEQAYWLKRNLAGIVPLPCDVARQEQENTDAVAASITASLSEEETRLLLEEVPGLYHSQINEVLLTALAQVLTDWTGASGVLIDLEGHGREDLFVDVDLSRTIGWFTSLFPVALDLGGSVEVSEAIRVVKEQMRAIPNHGIGYGILRYLSSDAAVVEALSAQPQAEVVFNYLGQLDQAGASSERSSLIAGISDLSAGPRQSERERRTHLLDISCQVSGNQFSVTWTYSRQVHRPATIERLVEGFTQALRQIIGQDHSLQKRVLTSTDFPMVDLSQDQLEHLLEQWRTVETITSLSAAQEGMLYETLHATEPGIHIEQTMYTLRGPLDVEVFERAWQWGVKRHAMLRTGFAWEEYGEPLQITLREVPIHVEYHDWRGISAQEQQARTDTYFREERLRGFDLARPPLMRLALLHLEEETYRFAWTLHHIVMDGWSGQVLLREVIACYIALSHGEPFQAKASPPYSEYIAWLRQQEGAQAEQFWRKSLRGFTRPTPLGREMKNPGENDAQERYGTQNLRLPDTITSAVSLGAQQHHVTLNTLIQGMWAILLSRYSGSQDVVFGITVSGRPAEIAGIETMVGLCINTLPLRVQVLADVLLWDWLEQLQQYMVEMHSYEYSPAGQMHQWSEVPATSLLYESLLVVENYPMESAPSASEMVGVSVEDMVSEGGQTKYALTFLVNGGANLSIQCIYDATRFAHSAIGHILEHFQRILYVVASEPEKALSTLGSLIAVEQIPEVYPGFAEEPMEGERALRGAWSPVENLVASVWCEVLGMQGVGRDDSFFAQGGHSLLVTQLIARIRTILGVEVPLRVVFEEPTVTGLARQIEQILRNGEARSLPPLIAGERPEVLPLSFAQQRLWFLDRLEPESTAYLIPSALRIDGRLDGQALEQALEALIKRHENLRTTFEERDGQPRQVIHPTSSSIIPTIDLQGLGHEQAEVQAHRLVSQESQHPCDLARGSLLRSALLHLAEEEHIFLLTLHHIITDGWSTGVLVQELTTLYEAMKAGEPSPLVQLPIQYADYALWQRAWLQGEVLEAQLTYWRTQLSGVAPLELPTDHPRPVVQRSRGASQPFQFSPIVSEQVVALSRQEHVTLFMLLLASFQVLLARYSGQQDISVGTPIANRRQRELEGVIGFFANTLVLRTDLSGDPTFQQLLQRVREVCLGAYAHQDLPFEKVVEELAPQRDLSRSPLFQVMLTLQNASQASTDLIDLNIDSLEVESLISKFDLNLSLVETEQGLFGALEYSTDLFEAETITRFLTHWQILLQGIVQDAQAYLWELPLLTDHEQNLLMRDWNATTTIYPEDVCVHHLFEQQVWQTPDAVALVYEQEHVTYLQLDQWANQFAQYLHRLGVDTEVMVGICLENSLLMAVSVLGVLKVGGTVVPVDPTSPKERLSFLFADAHLMLLLTSSQLNETLPDSQVETILFDRDWEMITQESLLQPVCEVSAENLVYVIYTSGSTGTPKGVCLPHRVLGNLLLWHRSQLQGGVRTLQFAPLSFDASFHEMFAAWCSGGTLCLMTAALRRDVVGLAHFLSVMAIEKAILPVVMLHQLAEEYASQRYEIPHLKEMLATGEQLRITQPLVEMFVSLHQCGLHNHYGPSESHVVTAYTLPDNAHEWSLYPSIGRPIANTQTYVLDASLNPVPIGSVGELYIGGLSLARGYLDRPALTAERFLPHPFASSSEGARVYKTGDQARYQVDGTIEYLGRRDQQVKIRGYRVELGEIEEALRKLPAVRDAVAVVREGTQAEKHLVAYVVGSEQLTVREMRRRLQNTLPEYMIPAFVVMLERLPLTPNGKVDRKGLPAPKEVQEDGLEVLRDGRSPLEELLRGVWREVLGRHQVGISDNFFEVGGHSLLATQLIARFRTLFAVEVPVRTIFEHPTIADMVPWIEQAMRQSDTRPLPPLVAGERPEVLPLSFAQQRLWFLDQLEPESITYLLPSALRIEGMLDGYALERAVEALIERHESLRTTFEVQDGYPRQVIHSAGHSTMPMIDLQGLGHEQAEVQANRLAAQEMQHPCDLVRGPLLRSTLLHLGQDEYIFLLTLHHIITDGWSNGVLVQELILLYEAMRAGESSPLAPLPMQYVDYALWQRAWLQGEVLEAQLAYWRIQLSGVAVLEVPTDHPRPVVQTSRGATQPFQLSPLVSEQLVALSQQAHVTLYMLLLAAFQVLLARYSGQQDISVGTPIANRRQAEVEGVIGFFVNTLVLRTDLSRDPTFQEVLQRVREVCLGAYSHQDVPFEKVVEELAPQRDLSRSPLFQVMLILQQATQEQVNPTGVAIKPLDMESAISGFDLILSLTETEQGFSGGVTYSTDLFEAETITRLLGHWQVLLHGIVQNSQAHVWQLPLLTSHEQNLLEKDWNATEAEYPDDRCVHELFEQQVQRTPEAVALVFEEQQLTYEQLNGRANQLAHYLHGLGVGPEVLVGICLPRSMEMIIGVLGILKAGGAYVPLDPTSPKERLDFLLRDADLSLVVTQQSTVEQIPASSAHLLLLDALWSELLLLPQHAPLSRGSVEHLAYLIYTSGSTGVPKGVQVTHRGVSLLGQAQAELFGVGAGSRVLQFAALTFDVSVWELLMALLSGASLHLLRADQLLPGPDLVQVLREQAVSVANIPPSVLAILPQEPLPDLQTLMVGGEACRVEVMMQWARGRHFYNAYGPTEATVCATVGECVPEPGIVPGSLSLGRPLGMTQVYVLDPSLQLVPVGVVGEICLGGSGLARGYLKRAEQTAERFVPHPFSREAGARLYRTGDRARYRADGSLEYLGRLDTQVKIRGYRIELGEIEMVLRGYAEVEEAVVLAREDRAGDRRLVGYVVGKLEEQRVGGEMRIYLQNCLPSYMIPSALVFLETLPLTANGKVDRQALPSPQEQHSEGSIHLPRTQIEVLLEEIWRGVLGGEQISIFDDFFEVGGHSLLATRFVARVCAELKIELSLRDFFQAPTIAGFAKVVEQEKAALIAQAGEEELAQALALLEAMSEDEIKKISEREQLNELYG